MTRHAVASFLAALAVLIPRGDLESPKANGGLGTIPVVVAAKDMPEGVTIDPLGLVVARWPLGTQPANAYTSVGSVTGRVTRVPVYRGEAIVPGRLAPEGTSPTYQAKVTPGKRPYYIRIADVASLGGTIGPDSRVDIMVVISNRRAGRPVAKLFASNMRVLAIGAAPERAQDGRPITAAVASIEVTPTEAERLAIAAAQGALQLVLRGDGDADTTGAVASEVVPDISRSKSRSFRRGPASSGGQASGADSLARPRRVPD